MPVFNTATEEQSFDLGQSLQAVVMVGMRGQVDSVRAALLISNVRAYDLEGVNIFDGVEKLFGSQDRRFVESVYFSDNQQTVLFFCKHLLPAHMYKGLELKLSGFCPDKFSAVGVPNGL